MSTNYRQQTPIAVIGVSALFPGSPDSQSFWNNILAGKDLITDVPPTHWLIEDYYDPDPKAMDKTYAKRGGFMPAVDFDPLEFGVPPNIVPATDSAQILALIVAQKVLEDAAQGQFSNMDRERISVLLGVTSAQELLGDMVSRLQKPVWLKALRESGVPENEAQDICTRIAGNYKPWQESSFPGLLGNVVAGRIANRFDLRGTNAVTDAACASSLAAISMGINELQLGQSDLVITGGVDAMNDIFMYMCFSKTPALSPSGDCRPFSDNADGTLLGEGIAMMALKRLDDAERDGDRVYAVIRGVGSASDGRANSVYAPLPEGQARALRRAYEVAGFGPETVELVEAHGTGTKAGDAAEFAGLKLAFGAAREDHQWCALGTVKSQIGHTKAAAGAAGLFKAVMALHHKVLPPTIKIERPNPKLEIESSPFYLNTQRRPWIRSKDHPRRAAVSSFGFGGSNFHVALEEYQPTSAMSKSAWRLRAVPTELVLLSAGSPAELAAACRALAQDKKELSHVARQTQLSFQSDHAARLSLLAATAAELSEKLIQAAAAIDKAPEKSYSTPNGTHYAAGAPAAGQLAFLFPGQGSQYVGMGAEAAMAFDVARQAWDDASNLSLDGERLQDVVFPHAVFTDADRDAQQKKLTATEWAQPALGVHSRSLASVLHAIGVRPDSVAGHSFGEVSALHEAGVFDALSLLKIARRRGELMRDASAIPGAMTAVAKSIDEVRAAVAASGADVVIANHNSPSQVVLSGSVAEITKLEAALAASGLTAKRLPVATAFHSPLVAGSSAPLRAFLDEITVKAPGVSVYSNATATTYPKGLKAIREQLAAQLALPVRFVDQIEAMYASGVRTFVEVGAGSVLTELVARILGDRPHQAISLDRKGKHGVTMLQEGIGRLALAGVKMDLLPLWADFAPPSDKPAKKPAMTMAVLGSNSGRPYPPPGGAKALPLPNPPRALPVTVAAPLAMPAKVAALASPAASTSASTSTSFSAAAPVAAAAPAMATPASALPLAASVRPVPTLSTPAVTRPAMAPQATLPWVHAFQETQRQTAEAHAAYQQAMADSHMAFLQTAQSSLAGLGAMLGHSAQHFGPAPVAESPPAVSFHAPLAVPAPLPVSAPVLVAPVAPVASVPAPAPAAVVKPVTAAVAPVLAAVTAAPAIDLQALMMSIVAEKTGYPTEMLDAHMELEADLGIDSIKRVEILAAMRERAPSLPEVKPTELAALRTLGQIVEHMQAAGGAGFASSAGPATLASTSASTPASTPAAVTAQAAAPAIDLQALMMSIVAEKTGYPTEMLGAHMELEADLGIDSIKRVEILAAMRERAPSLPEVKPTELAALRTLGQIVEHMQAAGGAAFAASAAAATPAAMTPATAAAVAAAPAIDLQALMMSIVAEKTGYPTEMLGAHMELEADLGIDSIKRVEILAAMRERAPSLPEVKPTELAALRTLGQIVEHMQAAGGAGFASSAGPATPASTSASTPAAVTAAAAPAIDLQALMMSIVAEKTGYPTEMLGAHMELEADLGIDSIKRVEILAAMRERAPSLPEVKPTELAALRTLGQIVEHMQAAGGAGFAASAGPATLASTSASTPSSTPAAVTTQAAAPAIDLQALMMSIVAEKTGYPTEMLGAHMELEADLGIDSIKRVEILAAMRERAPGLPEVKPTELAALRTLGQIVEHMQAAGGAPAASASAAQVSAEAAAQDAGVERFALHEIEAKAVGMALSGWLGAQRLVVTDDGMGVAQALAEGLAVLGVKARVLAEVPADADAVIFLGGLRQVDSIESAIAVNREAFRASRAVAARFSSEGGAFVTVQDTGGDFGLSGRDATRAFLGGVSALARTAALEWPAAAVKAIDMECASRDASALAQAIIAELLQGGTTLEVGLHADGRRTTLVSDLTPSPSPLAVANINAQSVVIASGGGRGVTAAALVALAKARQPRIALLGRTPMGEEPAELRAFADAAALKGGLLALAKASGRKITPAQLNAEIASYLALREIRATLAALQAAGSEARYIAVDVADAAALTSALQSVRSQWGPITAVVHGAGVLADKRIEDKSDAQFDRVFDTKVLGLRALLAATANDPLSALCLFSSVAARTGNLGQCDYAMANEVLNLVACAERRRRGASCTVRAIGWGPWEGGMVTPGLKAHFEQMGVALIPLATGARRFVEEMTGGGDDVSVVIGGAQGDGALGAAVTPKATLELRVDQHSHPFLADHCIGGVPVVPVVLVLEWFMRAASACCPGKVLAAVEQVKVMRGLKLDGFAAGGDRFTVTARQVSNGSGAQVAVELRGKGQALHYSATVTLSDSAAEQPTLLERPALKKWTRPEFYDGHVLFHGASLQVIQSVKGVSPEGIVGTLSGIDSAPNKNAWSGQAWRSDVAAMDGGLQLAVLWAEHLLGGAALPMAIGEYRSYSNGPGPGALECVVRARKVHAAGSVCDIAFIDTRGHVVAEMIGVETVLRPDAAPAASALA